MQRITSSSSWSKRAWFIAAIASVVIGGMLISCVKKDQFSMRILAVHGKATLVSGAVTTDLKPDATVNAGDTIVTEKQTTVDLYAGNQSAVRIYENTKFTVNARTVDPGGNITNATMGLTGGRIFVIIKKLAMDRAISVSTPTYVIAVRGTEFSVNTFTEKDRQLTKLDVVEGKVEIKSTTKPELADTLVEGDTITLAPDKKEKEKAKLDAPAIEKLKQDAGTLREKTTEYEKKAGVASAPDAASQKPAGDDKAATVADAGKKPDEKKSAAPADNKPPVLKTEKQIREYYNKLERVNMEDGSVLIGAVIGQSGTHLRIHTVNGIISVPKTAVVNVVMQ